MQVFFTFSRGKSREMAMLSPGRTAWERRTAFLPVNGMVAGYAGRGAAEGGKRDAGHMKMHSGIIWNGVFSGFKAMICGISKAFKITASGDDLWPRSATVLKYGEHRRPQGAPRSGF
ncbi:MULTISPECIES: hypothetical protein [unclassified Janthinobacterium]|uniref:hypothetical protein n=1 Tax=unclassified Janthinobacterium TaxID=2610881 RepID=UPI001E561B95|nr:MULTISPECIES: hypothetical protein [unclassified Janthinobacterium]MCC7645735.1 hypothetical protein [Janthinobacterium sp. EB271-G4-3-1]MCC7694508.1 hypothetical protein [Janthinobacterium sp. EB271-G4-3-2]